VAEPVVDADAGTAPFALVSSDFASGPNFLPQTTTEPIKFVFRNVTDAPQSAESLFVRQSNEATSSLQVRRASTRIGRVVAPGEDLEVTVAATVAVTPREERAGVRAPELEILLEHADGTRYRYAKVTPRFSRG
jgi:hypothetical protein